MNDSKSQNRTKDPGAPLPAHRAIAAMQVLRQPAAAWLAGLTPRGLRDLDIPRNTDGTYHARAIVEWCRRRDAVPTDDDPLLAAGDSPALERYREEKAREAKRRNDEAEGQLLQTGDMGASLCEIGRVFRARAEAIERIHGLEVGRAVREMIDAAEKEWEKLTATGPEEKTTEAEP